MNATLNIDPFAETMSKNVRFEKACETSYDARRNFRISADEWNQLLRRGAYNSIRSENLLNPEPDFLYRHFFGHDADQTIERACLYAWIEAQDKLAAKRSQQADRRLANDSLFFLTPCRAYSCYGGPEEGGWYYTVYEEIEGAPTFVALVDNDASMQRAWHQAERWVEMQGEGMYQGHGAGGCGDDDGEIPGTSDGNHWDNISFVGQRSRPYNFKAQRRPCYE